MSEQLLIPAITEFFDFINEPYGVMGVRIMGTSKDYEGKMEKTLSALSQEFAAIRAGRANPSILNKIRVDYYGTPTPINQIAAISVTEARTLTIQPWDASVTKAIEKAILKSDLGINPQNDGKLIRITFPPLSEERRQELIKMIHKYTEDAKVAIRSIRRDAMEELKAQKKKSIITEDDLKDSEKEIQDMTDKYCKELDTMCAKKEKELLEI
jgi:ribosome recycling factor